MYGGRLGESDLSAESTTKAYQLRDRASDAREFFITASYHRRVTGNLEAARETCELWVQTYPRDVMPHDYLQPFTQPSASTNRAWKRRRSLSDLLRISASGTHFLQCTTCC